jgi:hypothetical protein
LEDDPYGGDLFSAAVIVFELEIDQEECSGYVTLIEDLMRLLSSRREGTWLANELLERGTIPGDEIERIFAEAEALRKSFALPGFRGQFEEVKPGVNVTASGWFSASFFYPCAERRWRGGLSLPLHR